MADKKKKEEEVSEILSDLDSIFSGAPAELSKPAPPKAAPAPAPVVEVAPPPPPPPPVPSAVEAAPEPEPVIESAPPPPPVPSAVETAPEPEPVIEAAPPPPPVPSAFEAAPEPEPPAVSAVEPVIEAAAPLPPPAPAAAAEPAAPAAKKARGDFEHDGKKVPPENVRRVGFYYSVGARKQFDDFLKFFQEMAVKVSKKPLYVDVAFASEWGPGMDSGTAASKAREADAVGIVCLFAEGDRDSQSSDLDDVFGKQDLFLRVVAVADAMKRGASVELVVDLMLTRIG